MHLETQAKHTSGTSSSTSCTSKHKPNTPRAPRAHKPNTPQAPRAAAWKVRPANQGENTHLSVRGVARRTALGSWGEYKGGEKCTRLMHNSCSATSSSTSGFKGPMRTKTIENKTNNIRQLGLGRLFPYYLTRRSSLPSGPGGGFNRFAHSAGRSC